MTALREARLSRPDVNRADEFLKSSDSNEKRWRRPDRVGINAVAATDVGIRVDSDTVEEEGHDIPAAARNLAISCPYTCRRIGSGISGPPRMNLALLRTSIWKLSKWKSRSLPALLRRARGRQASPRDKYPNGGAGIRDDSFAGSQAFEAGCKQSHRAQDDNIKGRASGSRYSCSGGG